MEGGRERGRERREGRGGGRGEGEGGESFLEPLFHCCSIATAPREVYMYFYLNRMPYAVTTSRLSNVPIAGHQPAVVSVSLLELTGIGVTVTGATATGTEGVLSGLLTTM